jgi:hypothetical protein
MIIRHPLQDITKFIQAYDQCNKRDRNKFINDHIDLFNNLDFVCKFCKRDASKYQRMPDKFKINKKLVNIVVAIDKIQFQFVPWSKINDDNFRTNLLNKYKILKLDNLNIRLIHREI